MSDEPKKSEELSAEIKLYVKEQAEKYRNEALEVFSAITLIIGIVTGLGVYGSAKAYIDGLVQAQLKKS